MSEPKNCPACGSDWLMIVGHILGGGDRFRCMKCQHEWDTQPPNIEGQPDGS